MNERPLIVSVLLFFLKKMFVSSSVQVVARRSTLRSPAEARCDEEKCKSLTFILTQNHNILQYVHTDKWTIYTYIPPCEQVAW